jgi:hypothetical protein
VVTPETISKSVERERRHITQLLEIDVGVGEAQNLVYDAIQYAARMGQECQRMQGEADNAPKE